MVSAQEAEGQYSSSEQKQSTELAAAFLLTRLLRLLFWL
jgi:hypothetical protein